MAEKDDLTTKLFLLLFDKQGEIAEFLLGTLGVLWGLWVLNPIWDTFALPSYEGFSVFPEVHVGIFFLVLGLATLVAAAGRLRYARYVALFLNILAWMFVALLFLLHAPSNTAFPVYMMISFMSIWLHIRLVLFQEVYDTLNKVIRKHLH